MWVTTIFPNYKRRQQGKLDVLISETPLPAANATLKQPEKIYVQAHPANTDIVWVGPTGIQSDGSVGGYALAPGAGMFLPSHVISEWYAIAATAGQDLLYTYLTEIY